MIAPRSLANVFGRLVGSVVAVVVALAVVISSLVACDRGASDATIDAKDPAAMRTAMSAIEASLRGARSDEALRIATRLTEVAPQNGEAFELLARAQLARATSATIPEVVRDARIAAAAAYAQAVAFSPPSAGLLNAAGVAAQFSGDAAGAVDYFARAAAIDPSNPQHPLFAGLALLQVERFAEAQQALLVARTLDPHSPWPLVALSGLALHSGDANEALALAREARQLDARNDELRVAEAKALRKLARHDEVLTLLLALPPAAQLTEAITWEIAAAHEALGDNESGAQAWGKWAEISGSAEAAVDAARRWTEAGDPMQAQSWIAVAKQRGWRGASTAK
ncbi:MAG: hypothetical protein EXS17_07850 [Phycisphaerales bacterium]|nr:hypothetical protein [Phycisphaerales bacterium]